jgi:hypothetical protein
MITINGRDYVKYGSTVGFCVAGYYKARKYGVLLMDSEGKPFAFVVNNRHNEQFFVSCVRLADGRIRYMHSTTAPDEEILGLDKLGYMAGIELAQKVIKQVKESEHE